MPLVEADNGEERSIYSVQVNNFEDGDQLEVSGNVVVDVTGLHNNPQQNAVISSRLVLTDQPGDLNPSADADSIIDQAELSRANGANCVQNANSYGDGAGVCRFKKVAVARIKQDQGANDPLYVNFVIRAKPKLNSANDRLDIRGAIGGQLTVRKYEAEAKGYLQVAG